MPASVFAKASKKEEESRFSDVKASDYYAEAVEALAQMKVISGYEDGTFGAEKSVTRAEMSAIVCRVLDMEEDAKDAKGETAFDDVDENHWASGYINIAFDEGIINGYENGEFRPSNKVKYEEAIKMLVCALGLAEDIEVDPDDWSAAYIDIADENSITENLKGKKCEDATRGDISVMTYNGLYADVEAPTANVKSGTYNKNQSVKLTTPTENAEIYYTLDGSVPTASSKKYTKEIELSETATLKAVTVKNGVLVSDLMSETYTIKRSGVTTIRVKSYSVKFNLNYDGADSDDAPEKQTVRKNKTAEEPEAPVRDGYTFLGWYTDKDCTNIFDFNNTITKNITLYAKWYELGSNDNSFRITFDRNDGTGRIYQTQIVNTGDTIIEPASPTRELYGFTGWYMEAATITEFDFSTPVNSDFTLYAGWGNPNGDDGGLYAASDNTETIFSVSDINVNDDEVTITYNTNDVALINVEFFEDKMQPGAWSEENLNRNLELTPVAVISGYTELYGELATLELPIDSDLPDNFLVRAQMYDSESNSTEYITVKYTKTYELFDAQTIEDFDEDRVINFDNDNTDNFGVLKDTVIVIPEACKYKEEKGFKVDDIELVSDEGAENAYELDALVPDHLYTFPDKNAVISENENGETYRLCDLGAGDVVYVEGTTWIFKIKNVTENEDGSISFTQDENVTMLDFYDTLKVEFDGVEAEVNDAMLLWEVIDVDASGSAELGPFKISKEFNNGIEVTGSISGKVTGEVELSYDAHLFSQDYFEASFKFTTEITGKVEAGVDTSSNEDGVNNEWKNVVFKVDTRKIKLPTPVTGLDIYIKPSAQIDWSLSGDVSFTWNSKQVSGFKYNSDTGRTDIKKKENTVSIMAKGKAEAKIGPIIDIGVEVLGGVLSGGVVAEAGAKLTAEAEIGADDILNNAESKHACGLCVSGRADWYASASVKCSYKITNSFKGDIVNIQILDITAPIKFNAIPGKFFFSIINSSDSPFGGFPKFGGGDCTNKTYRTEFRVQDQNGQDLDNINVSVIKQGQNSAKSGKTPYVTYLYDGTYKASATINNATVSKTFAVNGNKQIVVLSADTIDTVLEGVVVDADNNAALSGVSIKISKGDVVIASADTDSNGKFKVSVPSGSLTVEFSKDNYLPFVSTETIHEGDANHSMGQIELTPGTGMGGFHGVIRDAVTNEPLSGVTLNLYNGWNNPAESNTAIRTLKTNSSGEFRFETVSILGNIVGLASGNYTLTASKEGYSDTSYNIVIYPGSTDENPAINETMSPEMNDGFYRIVLTWGMDPEDLDSHLVAQTSNNDGIHVFYHDKNPYPYYANLDVDDTDSEGPETITITNFDGLSNIRYAVHDYTNREKTSSDWLSNSGAIVRLYKGNQLLRTFNVPTGYNGTEWDVFSLDSNGRITSINTMTYNSSPSYVLGGANTANAGSLFSETSYEKINIEIYNTEESAPDTKE